MATTIETTNVITRFTTEYDAQSGRRAAREAKRVSDSIDGGFDKAAREAKQSFNKIEQDSRKSLKKVENNFKRSENRLTTLFKGLGTRLAAIGIGAAIGGAVNRAINAAGSFETLSTSFKVLTGDIGTANALIEELNDFSLRTPFRPEEINNSARTLLGFGRSAEIVKEDIELIGNAAAATGADLQSLSVVFGQVAGAGKLQGQDALQFINQGLPVYKLLEESLGKSQSELKELQSQGKITFKDLREAFELAGQEGGAFFEALEQQSKTFDGLKSTFQGFINEALRGVGNIFLPAAKETLKGLIELTSGFVDFIKNNTEGIRDFLSQISTVFGNAIRPVITAIKQFFSTVNTGVTGLEVFETIITRIARVFTVIGNVAASVIQLFTGIAREVRNLVSGSEGLTNRFQLLQNIFTNFPAVVNGSLEVIKKFISDAILSVINANDRLKLQFLKVKDFFLRNQGDQINALQNTIDERAALKSGETFAEAFNRGFNQIADINIEFDGSLDQVKKEVADTVKEVEKETKKTEDTVKKSREKLEVELLETLEVRKVAESKTADLLREQGRKERAIIEEQIRLNNFLASNVELTEAQKAAAVAESTEKQLQLQIELLEIQKQLLQQNGGSAAEILKVSKSISEVKSQLTDLRSQAGELGTFDSILKTLFPKGDLDGIKGELSNLYGELINLAASYNQRRGEILDQEYQAAEQRVNDILNLSEGASQKQLDFEQKRLEEAAKARDAFAKKSEAAAKIETAANIVAALARIAAESGLASLGTLPAFLSLFAGLAAAATQIFHEGTESVSKKGERAPDRGLRQNEVFAILEEDERVIDKKLNRQLKGMSNAELVKNAIIGKQMKNARINPEVIAVIQDNTGNMKEMKRMTKAIESMERTLRKFKVESIQNIDSNGITQMVEGSIKKYKEQLKRLR